MDLVNIATAAKKKYTWEVLNSKGEVENKDTSYLGCLQHLDARVTKEMVEKGVLFTRKRGATIIRAELAKENKGRTLRVTHNGAAMY